MIFENSVISIAITNHDNRVTGTVSPCLNPFYRADVICTLRLVCVNLFIPLKPDSIDDISDSIIALLILYVSVSVQLGAEEFRPWCGSKQIVET